MGQFTPGKDQRILKPGPMVNIADEGQEELFASSNRRARRAAIAWDKRQKKKKEKSNGIT